MNCVALFYWMIAMALATPLDLDRWQVVNDTVMGGVSSSEVVLGRDGVLEFRGVLSLENNGGFTSTRLQVNADWSGVDHLKVRMKGDGRAYLLTVRTQDRRMRRVYYRTPIQTKANEEMEWIIPIAGFEAFAYGTPIRQAPNLVTQLGQVGSVGVMLADKQPGPFSLKIMEIEPVSLAPAQAVAKVASGGATDVLRQAIEMGVPLYNQGDADRCYDVYRMAMMSILMLTPDQMAPAHQALFVESLSRAQMMMNPSEQAWTLRSAMDVVLMSERTQNR